MSATKTIPLPADMDEAKLEAKRKAEAKAKSIPLPADMDSKAIAKKKRDPRDHFPNSKMEP